MCNAFIVYGLLNCLQNKKGSTSKTIAKFKVE